MIEFLCEGANRKVESKRTLYEDANRKVEGKRKVENSFHGQKKAFSKMDWNGLW